ncbi:MAG: PqqD family protein [Bacteroidales bacterium]
MKIKKNIALSDSGFIFNPSSGESFSMNPIGLEIIKMLKEGKEKDDIKKVILDKYQTDDATFERDFYDFANNLNHYLLTEIDG